MNSPAQITFVNDYEVDETSVGAAAGALERAELVSLRWPTRTAELLQLKESGRETILADLLARGGDATGVEQFDSCLSEAQRYASAADRLPDLWRALRAVGASPVEASFALAGYVQFANLHIVAAISRIELRDEGLGLEDGLRVGELNKLYNSPMGHQALGRAEPIYAVDVEVAGQPSGNYIFAPAPLVEGLRVGDKVGGELLTCWTIPQSEAFLLFNEFEPDYSELTVWHVRNDVFEEI